MYGTAIHYFDATYSNLLIQEYNDLLHEINKINDTLRKKSNP